MDKHSIASTYYSNIGILTGMQVFSNPLITACEQTEVMNSTGEFTAERTSGMMANDTAGEGNETCIRCGKIDLSVSM